MPLLADGGVDQLDLQDIVTAPEYFLVPLRGDADGPGRRPAGLRAGGAGPRPADGDPGRRRRGQRLLLLSGTAGRRSCAGQASTWFFGESLAATRAQRAAGVPAATGARIRFGTLGANGAMRWGPPVELAPGATQRRRHVATRARPSAWPCRSISGRLPAHQADIVVAGRNYELDGSLSGAVRPGVWRHQGSVDHYSLFVRNRRADPSVRRRRRAPADSAHQACSPDGANPSPSAYDASTPVVVVRDVAWDSGWHASVSSDGGPARAVRGQRTRPGAAGQAPAGTDVVTFAYRPPHWLVASALSEASSLLLAILLVVALRRRVRSAAEHGLRPAPPAPMPSQPPVSGTATPPPAPDPATAPAG